MVVIDSIEFPYVLVANGKPRTLFSTRDYEDVLREYIGEDAVQFFRQAAEGADAEIKEPEDAVEDLQNELEITEAML